MKVTDFGATVKGDETKLYTLTNKNGMEIAVSDYGATLVQAVSYTHLTLPTIA